MGKEQQVTDLEQLFDCIGEAAAQQKLEEKTRLTVSWI